MLGRTDSRTRLLALVCTLILFGGALGVRLAYWQIGQGDDLRDKASEQVQDRSQVQAKRGDIRDSTGAVLATTAYRDRLAAYPDLLSAEDRTKTLRNLSVILGL